MFSPLFLYILIIHILLCFVNTFLNFFIYFCFYKGNKKELTFVNSQS
nr:MAG TPA: membrane protein [Caudoviricetes sp.]